MDANSNDNQAKAVLLLTALHAGCFTSEDISRLRALELIPSSPTKVVWPEDSPAQPESDVLSVDYSQLIEAPYQEKRAFTPIVRDIIRKALKRVPVSFLDEEIHILGYCGYIPPQIVLQVKWLEEEEEYDTSLN
jgi:hypothetical protein